MYYRWGDKIMSEFAFFRFLSTNMLSAEEKQHKPEILELTEEVLQAHGIECDSKISKISEEKLKEILEEVRKLRKKKRKDSGKSDEIEKSEQDSTEESAISEASIQ
jgi:hypothetical protein